MRSIQETKNFFRWIFTSSLIVVVFIWIGGCRSDSTSISGEFIAPQWIDVSGDASSKPPFEVFSTDLLPSTSVQFTLPAGAVVTMTIVDGEDALVAMLLDHQELDEGTHAVTFSAAGLSSGVYIYNLWAQEIPEPGMPAHTYASSRKMMLVK